MNKTQTQLILGLVGGALGLLIGVGSALGPMMPPEVQKSAFDLIVVVVPIFLVAWGGLLFKSSTLIEKASSLVLIASALWVWIALSYAKSEVFGGDFSVPLLDSFTFEEVMAFIPLFIVISTVPVMGVAIFIVFHQTIGRAQTLKKGISGTAAVRSQSFSGTRMNNMPMVKLTLEVSMPGDVPFEITKDFVLPEMVLHQVSVGSTLPIKMIPGKKSSVEIDLWQYN